MPETFLILLAGGVMLAAAIPNPKDVTLQWLRLAGIIALCAAALGGFFLVNGNRGWAILIAIPPAVLVLAQLVAAQTARRNAQRIFAILAFAAATVLPFLLTPDHKPSSDLQEALRILALTGIAAMCGVALMDMLLGHAYLTASQMTMAPFRRLNFSLGVVLILRAILSIGVTMLLNSRHPIATLWNIYGLYILTRWLVGLLIPGIFVWMAHDCIKRRATQSATGILYVASVLIFIGEIIALYLLRQTGLPF